jgi:transposase
LNSFATLSNGTQIENPRFYRTDEKALAKAQRRLSKFEKGTKERRKARKVVGRIHERIRNRRHNFVHQEACKIVNRFDKIAVEKLNVKSMVKNHCLPKASETRRGHSFDKFSPTRLRVPGGVMSKLTHAIHHKTAIYVVIVPKRSCLSVGIIVRCVQLH